MTYGQDTTRPYYIEGDEVVFVFDSRNYARAISQGTGEELDFADLDIYHVAVFGDFNRWSRDGWKMKKIDDHRYELRKKVADFSDAFPADFKYVINDEYWAVPGHTFPKDRTFTDDFFAETYNLRVHEVVADPRGNAIFYLEGYPDAGQVILTGDFLGWSEEYLPMQRVADGWQIRVALEPGRYEYKFIVDGEWHHDPENPSYVKNEHGTYNSVLQIPSPVVFQLKGFDNASQVMLVGSFNQWARVPLHREGDMWRVALDLPGGKHYYKFVVDGKWILDPDNRMRQRDREGIRSSVIIVK